MKDISRDNITPVRSVTVFLGIARETGVVEHAFFRSHLGLEYVRNWFVLKSDVAGERISGYRSVAILRIVSPEDFDEAEARK